MRKPICQPTRGLGDFERMGGGRNLSRAGRAGTDNLYAGVCRCTSDLPSGLIGCCVSQLLILSITSNYLRRLRRKMRRKICHDLVPIT